MTRIDLETEARAAIEHESVEGVIVWPLAGEHTVVEWQRMQDRGIALVCVDCLPRGLACDFVGVDNYGAARDAVEYLIRRGHRKIAHITTDEDAMTVRERMRGYRDAMIGSGNPPQPEWTLTLSYDDYTHSDEQVARFLTTVAPTAIFVMNDHTAHQAVTVAEGLGMVIGKDVSIIGFDDIDRYSPRPALLTTMRQPFERIGECAAELLLQRHPTIIAGGPEKVFRQYYLSAPLIERSTCGPLSPKGAPHHRITRGVES
jgi:DNA-binding LacI/PurR family transcriptional regulator